MTGNNEGVLIVPAAIEDEMVLEKENFVEGALNNAKIFEDSAVEEAEKLDDEVVSDLLSRDLNSNVVPIDSFNKNEKAVEAAIDSVVEPEETVAVEAEKSEVVFSPHQIIP